MSYNDLLSLKLASKMAVLKSFGFGPKKLVHAMPSPYVNLFGKIGNTFTLAASFRKFLSIMNSNSAKNFLRFETLSLASIQLHF